MWCQPTQLPHLPQSSIMQRMGVFLRFLARRMSTVIIVSWVEWIWLTSCAGTIMWEWCVESSISKFCLWVFGSSLEAHYKVFVFCRYIFWFRFDCCTVNAFILQRYFKPRNNCISRQILKFFCIFLAQGLIGGYNCCQKYSLPAPIYDVALHQSTPPAKRRRMKDTNTTPSDLDGHFPIKGE